MSKELESRIKDILITLPSTKIDGLKKLFWEELNYNSDNVPVSKANWTDEFSNLFIETPVSFATCAINDTFHILFFHLNSDKLLISTERQVVNKLIVNYPYSLFVFSNGNQDRWHFVNAIQNQDRKRSKQFILRRISVSKEDRLRTASERIAKLDVSLVEAPLFGILPIQIQKLHEAAFDVEAVTEEFFNEYKTVFSTLMSELKQQTSDKTWAHDFALQFMNRLMFIYYIERKEWLGNDPDFLHHFWREYLKLYKGSDHFVDEWLDVLFFEAFNKKFSAGRSDYQYIPEKFRTALQLAPYLNGGLFSKNELDEKHDFQITDDQIDRIMAFLDKYNFTISEDTPLDQEVAVDPEMIGKVYESLVNVSDEVDEQSDAGIFYTPRIEIDLMCRLSLVDWLSNHLSEISKNVLYEFVFAFNPEDKQDADRTITDLGLWPELAELLSGITVLDPACGSGSFLVGMLGVLDDLLIRANRYLNKEETPYERRKRIIGASLYGVDIMDWAVHVAELRLWLQLVIETDLDLGERTCQALLPSLSFKLRQGDSLVQEVGGLNLSLHRQGGQLNRSTVNQLKSLKEEKFKFFQNDPDRKYRTKTELTHAEFLLFEQVIADQIRTLEARKLELETLLNPGENLFGEVEPIQMDLDSPKRIEELALIEQNLESLRSARHVLHTQKTIPFIWDIAFVEIFEGDKQGFDIVIGNPPYTRQEAIRDLKLPEELSNLPANKKAYKAKVATAVYNAWPKTFGFNSGKGEASWKLDKKSDLYIYFYFIGLSLVNPQGSFCFITSNSWLDVGYGADLQLFLLTRGELKFVIDNQVKRSFTKAFVNTVIVLSGAPCDRKSDQQGRPDGVVSFVMFRQPFEEGLSPIIWEEIEEAKSSKLTNEYRVIPMSFINLLEEGLGEVRKKYVSGNWGKFLRAPDIYWQIITQLNDVFISIEPSIGHVQTVAWSRKGHNNDLIFDGLPSNDFIPIFKSPKDSTYIKLSREDSSSSLSSNSLKTKELVRSSLMWDDIRGDKHLCRLNLDNLPFTHNFHGIDILKSDLTELVCALLNSTLTWFFIEVLGRTSLGGGAVRILVNDLRRAKILVDPVTLSPQTKNEIEKSFAILSSRPVYSVLDEIKISDDGKILVMEDRKNLDKLIFDSLGFDEITSKRIYESTNYLVKNRLRKSGS